MFADLELSVPVWSGTGSDLWISHTYDLCLAWNWEFDAGFVEILINACATRGLSLLQVTAENLESALRSLLCGQLSYRVFFDRASDSDARYLPFVRWTDLQAVKQVNQAGFARRAWDKTKMDRLFRQAGIPTPTALVLPAFAAHPDLPPADLRSLNGRFAIKPAHGGGGKGVHPEATIWEQVCAARQEYPEDQYLIQEHISPVRLGGRPAWFRVIYFAGRTFPCWWDTATHAYTLITENEENRLSLQPLRSIASRIGRICRLELFSTEIALTPQGVFTVIDHVNDPIDLRLQSWTADGIPDEIVVTIAAGIAEVAANP